MIGLYLLAQSPPSPSSAARGVTEAMRYVIEYAISSKHTDELEAEWERKVAQARYDLAALDSGASVLVDRKEMEELRGQRDTFDGDRDVLMEAREKAEQERDAARSAFAEAERERDANALALTEAEKELERAKAALAAAEKERDELRTPARINVDRIEQLAKEIPRIRLSIESPPYVQSEQDRHVWRETLHEFSRAASRAGVLVIVTTEKGEDVALGSAPAASVDVEKLAADCARKAESAGYIEDDEDLAGLISEFAAIIRAHTNKDAGHEQEATSVSPIDSAATEAVAKAGDHASGIPAPRGAIAPSSSERNAALEEKYVAALAELPPWKCGRIDLNTYLPEPATVGRVTSDIVRYIYFEDGQEVIVLGQRADEIAYAASKYRSLLAQRPEISGEGVRPCVSWFASIMERELKKNDHKPGWQRDTMKDLFARLVDESTELRDEIGRPTFPTVEDGSARIIKEAADVANFAMMIADNIKRLTTRAHTHEAKTGAGGLKATRLEIADDVVRDTVRAHSPQEHAGAVEGHSLTGKAHTEPEQSARRGPRKDESPGRNDEQAGVESRPAFPTPRGPDGNAAAMSDEEIGIEVDRMVRTSMWIEKRSLGQAVRALLAPAPVKVPKENVDKLAKEIKACVETPLGWPVFADMIRRAMERG